MRVAGYLSVPRRPRWAMPEGGELGPYIAVRNHNTNAYHTIDPKEITWAFKTPKWLMWGSMLGALVVVGFLAA